MMVSVFISSETFLLCQTLYDYAMYIIFILSVTYFKDRDLGCHPYSGYPVIAD